MATRFTRDRGFTAARRIGADEEFREMVDDPDTSFSELLAAIIDGASEEGQVEIAEALRDLGMDTRGPRSWARDRLERRRLSKDSDARIKRMGRDDPWPDPRNAAEREGEDRRRMAGDNRMALDRSPGGTFRRLFPNAAQVERA